LVGRQEGHPACKKLEWWGAGVIICLERGADLHMAQLMPLPLTVSCFRLVLPFWYRLTWVVPEKGPLNGRVCVFCHKVTKISASCAEMDIQNRTTEISKAGFFAGCMSFLYNQCCQRTEGNRQ